MRNKITNRKTYRKSNNRCPYCLCISVCSYARSLIVCIFIFTISPMAHSPPTHTNGPPNPSGQPISCHSQTHHPQTSYTADSVAVGVCTVYVICINSRIQLCHIAPMQPTLTSRPCPFHLDSVFHVAPIALFAAPKPNTSSALVAFSLPAIQTVSPLYCVCHTQTLGASAAHTLSLSPNYLLLNIPQNRILLLLLRRLVANVGKLQCATQLPNHHRFIPTAIRPPTP